MWLFAPAFAGHFRSDDAKLTSFFGDALDAGAGDPALACCLLNATSWGIAVNARPLTSLLPRLSEDGYPLSRAIVTGLAGDLPAAVELLLRARPGSEIEEVVRLCLIAQARAGITAVSSLGYLAAVADDQSRVHVVKFAIDDDDEAQVLQVITPAERPRGDDDVLVSVADDEDRIATACAWSMLEDNLAVRLRHQRAGDGALDSIVKAVAMSEDQNAIVTGHMSGAWLWDATTGALRGCLSRGFIGSVGFTHAGDIVLAARGTRGVRVIRWTEPATDATTAEETR